MCMIISLLFFSLLVKDIVITYISCYAIFNAKRCTRCKLYFIILKRDDRKEKISLYNLQFISQATLDITLSLCHLYFKWQNRNLFILTTNFN